MLTLLNPLDVVMAVVPVTVVVAAFIEISSKVAEVADVMVLVGLNDVAPVQVFP